MCLGWRETSTHTRTHERVALGPRTMRRCLGHNTYYISKPAQKSTTVATDNVAARSSTFDIAQLPSKPAVQPKS